MMKYLTLLRVNYYFKNILIFIGFLCNIYLQNYSLNLNSVLIVLIHITLFSLGSSSNYIINEYTDRKNDSYHPDKKKRFFTKKKINFKLISIVYLIFLFVPIIIIYFLNKINFVIFFFYILLGLIYNIKPIRTKDIKLLDAICEGLNAPLRFIYGYFIIPTNLNIPLTLVIFTTFFGILLMTIKRHIEHKTLNKKKLLKYRKTLIFYNLYNTVILSIICIIFMFFFLGIFIYKYNLNLIPIFILLLFFTINYLKFYLNPSQKKFNSINPLSNKLNIIIIFLIIIFFYLNVEKKEIEILEFFRIK
jgi:decaprenyl-phosphate phosphoribosyltransferase